MNGATETRRKAITRQMPLSLGVSVAPFTVGYDH